MNRHLERSSVRGKRFALALFLALAANLPLPTHASQTINFEFTDTRGKTLHLSDFQGKWVLVNFWAPWCPLCMSEIPLLNALNKREDMVVIGVALDAGPFANVVHDSAKSHNFNVTAIINGGSRRDPKGPYRQVGDVVIYPTSYLYDPTGEVVMVIPGPVFPEKLDAFMENWNRERGWTRS